MFLTKTIRKQVILDFYNKQNYEDVIRYGACLNQSAKRRLCKSRMEKLASLLLSRSSMITSIVLFV